MPRDSCVSVSSEITGWKSFNSSKHFFLLICRFMLLKRRLIAFTVLFLFSSARIHRVGSEIVQSKSFVLYTKEIWYRIVFVFIFLEILLHFAVSYPAQTGFITMNHQTMKYRKLKLNHQFDCVRFAVFVVRLAALTVRKYRTVALAIRRSTGWTVTRTNARKRLP